MNCEGCNKRYVNEIGLLQHLKRTPLCKKWIDILSNDNKAKDIQTNKLEQIKYKYSDNHEMTCSSCQHKFTNIGNLNRHLSNNIVCLKYTMFNNEPIKTNESELVHLTRNLFFTNANNLDKEIEYNNIGHIICILPHESYFEKIERNRNVNISYTLITYNDNYGFIDNDTIQKFEESYDKIEELHKNKKNTLIFCNNGYELVLPFICKYLISRHQNEVPNIGCALDIILPRVDKNYAIVKDSLKRSLGILFKLDVNKCPTNFFTSTKITFEKNHFRKQY